MSATCFSTRPQVCIPPERRVYADCLPIKPAVLDVRKHILAAVTCLSSCASYSCTACPWVRHCTTTCSSMSCLHSCGQAQPRLWATSSHSQDTCTLCARQRVGSSRCLAAGGAGDCVPLHCRQGPAGAAQEPQGFCRRQPARQGGGCGRGRQPVCPPAGREGPLGDPEDGSQDDACSVRQAACREATCAGYRLWSQLARRESARPWSASIGRQRKDVGMQSMEWCGMHGLHGWCH